MRLNLLTFLIIVFTSVPVLTDALPTASKESATFELAAWQIVLAVIGVFVSLALIFGLVLSICVCYVKPRVVKPAPQIEAKPMEIDQCEQSGKSPGFSNFVIFNLSPSATDSSLAMSISLPATEESLKMFKSLPVTESALSMFETPPTIENYLDIFEPSPNVESILDASTLQTNFPLDTYNSPFTSVFPPPPTPDNSPLTDNFSTVNPSPSPSVTDNYSSNSEISTITLLSVGSLISE